MKILVTGGLGYIGSHTIVELLEKNYEPIIIDNLSNSIIDVKNQIQKITNKSVKTIIGDLKNIDVVERVFQENSIECVIHFAGYKAVGESTEKPIDYYENNIISTINLIKVMKNHNCKNLIFSSSATVYGNPERIPLDEDCRLEATNPYGRTKLFIEQILKDLHNSDQNWNIILLRYFNPVGAHHSGLIGERPNGIPNNLVPYISQVANGKMEFVRVWGNDYQTKDGTGVRDYIHVCDLALGHVLAIDKIKESCGLKIYNLGTGKGSSVLQVIKAFEIACGKKIPYKIFHRRPGDIAECYADISKAKEELGFEAIRTLEQMIEDQWNFQKNIQ